MRKSFLNFIEVAALLIMPMNPAASQNLAVQQHAVKIPSNPHHLMRHFNPAAANSSAPVYDPRIWNDGDDGKVKRFYASHQPELRKIADKEGRLYVWPLAQLLRRMPDGQVHDRYGLSLEEAAEFRKAFGEMTSSVELSNDCYSYAVNHPYGNPPGWKLSPGEISGLGVLTSEKSTARELIRRVKADGLLMAGSKPKKKPGYYLAAMYVIPGKDYHFLRQNRDGSWSQKIGDDVVTNLDFSDRPIVDPRKANLKSDTGEYQFISYLYVPEGGLQFSAETVFSKTQRPDQKPADAPKALLGKPGI